MSEGCSNVPPPLDARVPPPINTLVHTTTNQNMMPPPLDELRMHPVNTDLNTAPVVTQAWLHPPDTDTDHDGCNPADLCVKGTWPSYMIDAPAVFNRVMSWASYFYQMQGEL
jgi:hypothetical protein